ncbi:hypothetical protein PHLGIDRAFT_121802 [Phlebiopsis gigantea 11061_1 CR5-6]|uniref:C3H1-type domain-containing protein n=1 Tax=Phlebiopsis gigantea (strain 11061_1 CR5-6) TaxID=745531 RepID=A0A0C3S1M4_PHLG1|nr:hypothetical protein PHLGIDRAFT_121802 [Phlebiopsis gigantea 11061_1 CR5-6]
MPDVEYTRNFSICKSFVTDGMCTRQTCQFSHALLDIGRVSALVGDINTSSQTSLGDGEEKVYFLVEYTKYSTVPDDADPDETKWRMKLVNGGRATLRTGGLGTDASVGSVSVQPTYPTKGQAREAVVAMTILERKVFGRTHPPDPERRTLCRQFMAQCCRRGHSCTYSHTLFDTTRVEQLLAEGVQERGYKDYRPLIEIEYLRQAGPRPDPMWRVTLRCIVGGYQQKASPQPVVATGTDLNSAFSLLERQFAASSGKPQEQQGTPQAGFSNHRRSSTAPPRPSGDHRRRRSAPANNASRSSNTHPTFTASPSAHDPPPSYQDAMGGNFTPSSSHDSKRRL